MVKAIGKFDRSAVQYPYMFAGALASIDFDGKLIDLALSQSVSNTKSITAAEASVGWAITADVYYALGDDTSAAAVSEAAYKTYKGSAKAFKDACGEQTWALWLNMGNIADEKGIVGVIQAIKTQSTHRDNRRLVILNSLYFAGLTRDEPGGNRVAWGMRDNRGKHDKVTQFIMEGPTDFEAVKADADRISAELLATYNPTPLKRKRTEDDPHRKVRRSSLFQAITDVCGSPPASSEITEEEKAFLENGPKKLPDIIAEADIIARKRTAV